MTEQRHTSTFDAQNHLAIDAYCCDCAHNLRGLPRSGRCPECGTQILWSLHGGIGEAGRDVRWMRPAQRGVELLNWTVIWVWFPPAWILVWIGCWRTTVEQRPSERSGWLANPARLLLAILPAAFSLAALPQLYLYWEQRGSVTISPLDGFVNSVLAIGAAHVALSAVAAMRAGWRYLSRLALVFAALACFFAMIAAYGFACAAAYIAGLGSAINFAAYVVAGATAFFFAMLLTWRVLIVLGNRMEISLGHEQARGSAQFAWQRVVPGSTFIAAQAADPAQQSLAAVEPIWSSN